MTTTDKRIQELTDLAHSEGITLPMDARWIVAFEDAGAIVDLHTGKITNDGADQRVWATYSGWLYGKAART